MSFNQTTDDLRVDALLRSGEPGDSSSSFWDQSLGYLNRIQQDLVMGGGIAVGQNLATSAGIYSHVVNPAITDWPWCRRTGVITTQVAIETGTASFVLGSTTVTFSSAPVPSVVGYRVFASPLPTVPLIIAHVPGATTATMDAPWPEVTSTGVTYTLFPDAYNLPADFLRFATPPYTHAWWRNPISVMTREQQDTFYPLGLISLKSPPTAAYIRPGGTTIALSTWDVRSYRLEFEYIAFPAALIAGSTPLLPPHYRSVLAIGAAMLISFDKDDDRARNLASEFREKVSAMGQEWRRAMSGGSSLYGVFKTRQPANQLRSLQPMGELYLL